jgi:hypothetical protein
MVQQRWKGIVKGGAVVLEEPLPLPDGTTVFIVPEEEEKTEPELDADPFLRVDEWAVQTGVPNLASDFERLLYGIGEVDEGKE